MAKNPKPKIKSISSNKKINVESKIIPKPSPKNENENEKSFSYKLNDNVREINSRVGNDDTQKHKASAKFIQDTIDFNIDSLNNIKGISEKERTELKKRLFDQKMKVTKSDTANLDRRLNNAKQKINMQYIQEPPNQKSDIIKKQDLYNDIQNKKASIKSKL